MIMPASVTIQDWAGVIRERRHQGDRAGPIVIANAIHYGPGATQFPPESVTIVADNRGQALKHRRDR